MGLAMALGKQAKVIGATAQKKLLEHVGGGRHPERDRVMVLLSFRAGLRAKEIAGLTWSMVLDAEGELAEAIALPNSASKGRGGGRTIPVHPELLQALDALRRALGADLEPSRKIIYSERADGYSAAAVANWFADRYRTLKIEGASSHSGRRTFITALAKNIVAHGGSLRDVQQLAGHSSLATTQRYIEGDSEAKRKAIAAL